MTTHLPRLPLSSDPLIAEAKQRTRRRRLLVVAALVGVAALVVTLAHMPRSTGHGTFHSTNGRWVPAGVAEVDVQAPGVSLRVTDPSQVGPIVAWFNRLTQHRRGPAVCAGGWAANVSFTFRRANGTERAKAESAPVPAGSCNPIHFTVGAKPETWLYDPTETSSLIARVQHLLGVGFREKVYRG